MCRTVFKTRFFAAPAEPIAESAVRVRFPKFCHEKREIAARTRIDDGLQFRKDRQGQCQRTSLAPFESGEPKPSIPNVLTSEKNNVGSANAKIKQQGQRQPRPRS